MTSDQEQELINAAQEGVRNAFTGTNKSDDFRIGAAVFTDKGNIYASGQYYSDTYSLTLHAEQAALAHAAAHGEYGIVAIAVAWNESADQGDDSVYPCHMCKQLLYESSLRSKLDTEILIVEKGRITERFPLSEVMSRSWPKNI